MSEGKENASRRSKLEEMLLVEEKKVATLKEEREELLLEIDRLKSGRKEENVELESMLKEKSSFVENESASIR